MRPGLSVAFRRMVRTGKIFASPVLLLIKGNWREYSTADLPGGRILISRPARSASFVRSWNRRRECPCYTPSGSGDITTPRRFDKQSRGKSLLMEEGTMPRGDK